MCFFETNDILLWVNLDEYEQRLMLRLQLTPDRRRYNDHFTLERPLPNGQGAEVLYKLHFKDITDISYAPATTFDGYVLCFEVPGVPRLREIKVAKHCFSYFRFKKMVKLWRQSK